MRIVRVPGRPWKSFSHFFVALLIAPGAARKACHVVLDGIGQLRESALLVALREEPTAGAQLFMFGRDPKRMVLRKKIYWRQY